MSTIRIAAFSFAPEPAQVEENARRIAAAIAQAKQQKCDIALFPETALIGYCLGDRHRDPELMRRQETAVDAVIAPACTGITAIVGVTYMETGIRRNGAVVLSGGRRVHRQSKVLLADEGVLEDSRHFEPGTPNGIAPVRIPLAGGGSADIGVLVCQDMWDDAETAHPARLLAIRGAQLLCVINASPFHWKKRRLRVETAARRVAECGIPLVYANLSGLEDVGKNLVLFDGHCFALSQAGLEETVSWEGTETLFDVPLSPVERTFDAPVPQAPALVSDALIFGIREFFRKSAVFETAVIGLSGGIDSAVDALLLERAIGKDRLICINMPTRFNSRTTRDLAAHVASRLQARYIVHPIEDAVNIHAEGFARFLGHPVRTLTLENIQARERGNVLMAYAQEFAGMVVGNGNKTEFQRGYATLYGDLVGALMPLGDVHKLLVYAIGRHLDPNTEVLPPEIYRLIPSAELSEQQDITAGRGDPFDYFIEAPMGVELIENARTPAELKAMFIKKELDPDLWIPDHQGKTVYEKMDADRFERYAQEVRRAIERSFFKRIQSPPVPVISPRAFGLDLHETLFGR